MIIKKPFLLFMVLLICSLTLFDSRSEGQPAQISEITDIAVHVVNGTTEIEIKTTAPFTYTLYKQTDPYHIIVDMQNTDSGRFTDKIVVDSAGILEITPVKDEIMPNVARFEIALTVPADVEPIYKDNSLILAFDNPEVEETETAEVAFFEGKEEEKPAEEEMSSAAVETVDTAEEPFAQKKYVGEEISIDFQDVELVHVFRLIAEISGFNIVVSPDVKGKFSMKLINVPWDQALDVILRNYGLSKITEGNIIRVAPTSVLAKEEEEIARAKESQEKSGDLVTRVYAINYAAVKDIKKAIDDAKILTKRGFISVDERTSSVIIKDVEKRHADYENLIHALDQPTPQVSIDAKIVEVTSTFAEEFGIRWGMLWSPPDTRMTIGGTGTAGGNGYFNTNPLMINLPSAAGIGKGGEIGFGYINASQVFALDMQLSAMESTGNGKIISNPKITTSDNQQASIMQGKKIPYQTVSQEGTQTQFVDAVLELVVTPHITPEGTIVMNINAKKNEADLAGAQVLGVPTIDVKEVKTQVLIKDYDTLVIGGIFKNDKAKNKEEVPGFSKIPILGRLFRYEKEVNNTNELLIFITPRIVTPMGR
ncbi:MAG TPA: type IV pilus secretin family protein [Nitrospirae bacterium]|nr:type IV pilus biogenesis and competence protein PilQ precursor [bacterium BMS3Abin06]HDH12135.1 type IV pilus secretin family protein [Nitrospirota bacterium]HDZ02359.1 type IV pilus secretin family protein [Nitrospirota bacterium]